MKVICTTSDKYLHILPIFCYLFNKFWGADQEVEIVGYRPPNHSLPSNFTFHSLGRQVGSNKNFSNDLIPYFDKQDRKFIWLMEDTFLKAPVNKTTLDICRRVSIGAEIGRVSLTNNSYKEYTEEYDSVDLNSFESVSVYALPDKSEYRLSTMPAIWKKDFLLQYLTKNLNPWEFECQEKVRDHWKVVALDKRNAPITHNEGVRRFDIFKYNLEGIPEEMIMEMKALNFI